MSWWWFILIVGAVVSAVDSKQEGLRFESPRGPKGFFFVCVEFAFTEKKRKMQQSQISTIFVSEY